MTTNLCNTVGSRLAAAAIVLIPLLGDAQERGILRSNANPSTNLVQTYLVNKKVSDFPTNEDLSTPESAYAV